MNAEQFWQILKTAYVPEDQGTLQDWFDSLREQLLKRPPEEIVEFGRRYDALVGAAYKADLWGAAYLINGGCSDDGFHAFRCWLVGMGRDVYEKALADPDSLADVLHGDWPHEAYLDAAAPRAWEEKTGRTDREYYAELDKLRDRRPDTGEDEGEFWDFDDDEEMRRRFPRLCRLYLTEDEE